MLRPLAAIISRMASSKPRAMGNIMAAVAVLLIQPEQSMQARPMAKKMRLGLSPTQRIDTMPYEMRRSMPLTVIALAMMKPPMKRKIVGLAKAANASFMVVTPSTTHSVGPKSEVTGMGTGSVIHHRQTSVMMASNLWASGERDGMGVSHTRMAQIGPQMAPNHLRLLSNELFRVSSLFTMGAPWGIESIRYRFFG